MKKVLYIKKIAMQQPFQCGGRCVSSVDSYENNLYVTQQYYLRLLCLDRSCPLAYALSDDRSLVRCAHTTIRSSVFSFRLRLLFPTPSLSLPTTRFVPHKYTIWLVVEWYGDLRPLASFAPPPVFYCHMSLCPTLQQVPIYKITKLNG
jgi:hypothetical protein